MNINNSINMVPRSSVDREFEYIVVLFCPPETQREDAERHSAGLLAPACLILAPSWLILPPCCLPKSPQSLPKSSQSLPKAFTKSPQHPSEAIRVECSTRIVSARHDGLKSTSQKPCKVCQNEKMTPQKSCKVCKNEN